MIKFHPGQFDSQFKVKLQLLDQSSLQKDQVYLISIEQDVFTEMVMLCMSCLTNRSDIIKTEKRKISCLDVKIYSFPAQYKAHCIAVAMGLGLYCKPRPQTFANQLGGFRMEEFENILTVRQYNKVPTGTPEGCYGINIISWKEKSV